MIGDFSLTLSMTRGYGGIDAYALSEWRGDGINTLIIQLVILLDLSRFHTLKSMEGQMSRSPEAGRPPHTGWFS